MPIKTKFGIVVMLSIFLGVSATSFLNYSIFRKEMVDTLIARKEGVVRDVSGEVNSMLFRAFHASEMVRNDRNTVNLMRYRLASQLTNVRNLLHSAQIFLSPAANIIVADMDGDVLAYSVRRADNISEEDYFEEAKSSLHAITTFTSHPEYPFHKNLLIATQVKHFGANVGIVAVLIDLYDLLNAENGGPAGNTGSQDMFRQALMKKYGMSGDDTLTIIDGNGQMVFYAGDEKHRFTQIMTDEVLSTINQEQGGYIETGEHFLFFSAIPRIGGYVVMYCLKPSMYSFVNQMKTMNVTLHILIFGLALFCTNLLTRAVIPRLQQGVKFAQAVISGEVSGRLDEGDDEFGVMFRAFNVMLTHLEEAIGEAKAQELNAVEANSKLAWQNSLLEVIVDQRTAELTHAKTQAEEASQAKTMFLASMSHEIRTPLNAIIGLTEIELRNDLNIHTLENLEKVHRAGTLLLGIINDILDVSKIESGKFQLVPVKYYFANLVSDTIHQNVPLLAGKPVTFETFIDENIPVQLYGDEIRIRQVLTNLLSNAFKYTDEGKATLSIRCDRHGNEAQMEFVVSDTGRGIKKEDFSKLFSEYRQLDMRKNRKVGGTGLGLSICKNLVDMMGGLIEVKSEYGKGSSFKAVIGQGIADPTPIGLEAARNLRTFRMDKTRRDQNLTRRRIPYGKVLVVDDVLTNLDVAKGLMAPYELTIHCASGGKQAVGIMREEKTRYDMIFMDHMMPEMDGIEAVSAIRELGTEYARNIPVIALTANALVGNEEFFLSNDFQGFLSKPIDVLKLDDIINKWIPHNPELETQLREKIQEAAQPAEAVSLGGRSLSEWTHFGLDIAEGTRRYGLDAYLEIIRSYAAHTPALLDKLRIVSEETLKDYAVTVHGIKGSSYGTAAKKVGKLAEALENAAKDGNFTAIMRDNGPFLKEADALLEAMSDLLKKSAGEENGAKKHVHAPDNDLLGELRDACSKYDIAAMDAVVSKLESYTYDSQSELVEWLREQLENLEYASMSERLEKILGNE